jgi:N-acetylneuraminate lyase
MVIASSGLCDLIAAAYTPMHADGSLNLDAVERLAGFFLAQDIAGVFVAGTTGESHSLTVGERRRLVERWRAVTAGTPLGLIVHIGHQCQAEAVALARHAREQEVDGVAALAPSYFKPATVDDLVDFLAPVADAAPGLPFYYYHIPPMTGLALPLPLIVRRCRERIPNFAGFKYSSHDLEELQAAAAADPTARVFYGTDQVLLAAVSLGVRAAVGSTYNFAAPLYHRILDAFAAGDLEAARHEQSLSVRMVRAIAAHGFLGASKALMKPLGVDCGPVRSPLRNVSEDTLRRLLDELEPLDVLAPVFSC